MSNDREDSPDWLRAFQAPTRSILTLSSDSESPPDDIPGSEDAEDKDQIVRDPSTHKKVKNPNQKVTAKSTPTKKTKKNNLTKSENSRGEGKLAKRNTSETHEPNHSVWALSSDSESCPDASPVKEDSACNEELSEQEAGQRPKKGNDKDTVLVDTHEESLLNGASKLKSPKKKLKVDDQGPTTSKENSRMKRDVTKNCGDVDAAEEEAAEEAGPYVSSSRLPLVLSEKVQRSKALVECEGESIDLSGDLGSVGRVVISDMPSGSHEMFLDLKGTIYKTTIVPSRTFCVVNFGPSEAKIEAIMSDFIQLKPQSNVFEAETMVEGTLEGFSFDSEDEADNLPNATTHQTDENEDVAEQQNNGKGKRKAEIASGPAKKKVKVAAKKPPKKVQKKAQVSKKTKTKR